MLILSSHLFLVPPSGLFPSFPTKTQYTRPLSPTHATCLSNPIPHLITQIIFGKQYRSLSSSLFSCLHSPVTSTLLGPKILHSTLFSNTLSLRSSLNVSDQVYSSATHLWKISKLLSIAHLQAFKTSNLGTARENYISR